MFLVNRVKNIPIRTHALKYSPATPAHLQERIDSNDINKYLQGLLTQNN